MLPKTLLLIFFYFSRIGTYQYFISDVNKDFALHPLYKESFSDLSVDVAHHICFLNYPYHDEISDFSKDVVLHPLYFQTRC